ncbi:MAG TPA: PP2C family serine/threonine-protein phosphatase, partial [Aggregatilineales bacterium]|nr:PP2C family serine/threonine-protein phosphatase [Aggregatilineales bacterium]
LRSWLGTTHRLYVLYTEGVDADTVRDLASITAIQPLARAPYRIAQQNGAGLEHAMRWLAEILEKLIDFVPFPATPPVKFSPARWRYMPSNPQEAYFYPEQFSTSLPGVGGYQLVAASHRGKTHAHQGTFREDAVAIATTPYWNILAVADGAGTADLARVGSNLAVTNAIEAIKNAASDPPETEDVGRAVWEGMKAAYQTLKEFAADHRVNVGDLSTTLQLLIHWPQGQNCLLGLAHIGDGIITAENPAEQYYLLTEPDTDPEDATRTLFLTSAPLKNWRDRVKVYQFDEPLDIVALMTDGLSGDLEPYAELLHTRLFESLRERVLCYPLKQQERALLARISYDRRGSFDDRTIAVLSRA